MTFELSITMNYNLLVNLFCSFLWIFRSVEGQFVQNIEQQQPMKRVIVANRSFSNLSLTNVKVLDVQKLNKLLSLIDKTWILPCPGTYEPVGSNFKYKRTCENIYQANNGICQQISYGIMCFNYCYEQGEILQFRCQDISDPIYCKNNSAYDLFLIKYQNDPYKAKSYIRQMISRCYATAICDSEHGILNTTIIDESSEDWESDNEASNLSLTTDITKQKISQITEQQQQRSLQMKPTRPIPIWQLLLLRHKAITATKSFPIVEKKEENGLTDVLNKENSKNFGNTEITKEENNSNEISVENSSEYKQEKVPEETTISTKQTISKKDENKMQLMEQLWWWCKALQQMSNNTDYLSQ